MCAAKNAALSTMAAGSSAASAEMIPPPSKDRITIMYSKKWRLCTELSRPASYILAATNSKRGTRIAPTACSNSAGAT
jgi:hypothetical protein